MGVANNRQDRLFAERDKRRYLDVYLAGPMRGYDQFNFPAFDAAAERLRQLGHTVFSPAERDRGIGFDETKNSLEGFSVTDAMQADLAYIIRPETDGIVLLPGWEKSKGANIEKTVAEAVGKRVMYYKDGLLLSTDPLGVKPEAPPATTNTEQAGGTRFSSGKPSMWHAPWMGLMEVCRVSTYGGKKYAPLDWERGQSFSTLLNSGMRHMLQAMSNPLSRDEESGLLHLGHAAWNLLTLLHFVETGRTDLDDITKWQGVSTAEKARLAA